MGDEFMFFADPEGRVFRLGPKPYLHEWRYDMERRVWRLIAREDGGRDPYWGGLCRRVTEGEVTPVEGPGIDELGSEEGPPWPNPA